MIRKASELFLGSSRMLQANNVVVSYYLVYPTAITPFVA